REQTIELYVDFVKKRQKQWDFYVTFDYERNCPLIYKVTKRLESMGIKPAPVYHGDSTIDWFKRYLDEGYTRLGVSPMLSIRTSHKNVRNFLDNLFRVVEPYKGVKLHGFAMTSLSLMFGYPWHSVDSSSWSRTSSYGCIYGLDPDRNTL